MNAKKNVSYTEMVVTTKSQQTQRTLRDRFNGCRLEPLISILRKCVIALIFMGFWFVLNILPRFQPIGKSPILVSIYGPRQIAYSVIESK